MFQVLERIRAGRLDQALIRLWLLAENRDGGQALSRWLLALDRTRHDAMTAKVFDALRDGKAKFPAGATDQPLALIAAVDRWLGNQVDLPLAPEALPYLDEGGTRYWLIRRRGGGETPADRQPPNLEQWFRGFRVVPNRVPFGAGFVAIRMVEVVHRAAGGGAATLDVRVSHFADGAATDFCEDEAGGRFHARGIVAEDLRREALQGELEHLRELAGRNEDAAAVWLAPELTVSPQLREEVKSWLTDRPLEHLLLCVPGSFHETAESGRVNRAEIVDGDGIAVAQQDKLSLFSYARQRDGELAPVAVGGSSHAAKLAAEPAPDSGKKN